MHVVQRAPRARARTSTRLLAIGALVACIAAMIGLGVANPASAGSQNYLAVQLKWIDQAQFAGFYVASNQGFFADRGLTVRTLPGSSTTDPMHSLIDGQADVAVASMAQAEKASVNGKRYVNIAQIFQIPDSRLICRIRPGFTSSRDLRDARFAVSRDRQPIVTATFARIFPGVAAPTYLAPSVDTVRDLVDDKADCIWGSIFNEVWRAQDYRLNIFTVNPADYGVVNIEDGLYVDEARLSSSTFRDQLTAMLAGLRDGWAWAAKHPSSTVQIIVQQSPSLEPVSQRRQLESVLPLLGNEFGYFNLDTYETRNEWGLPALPTALGSQLWTHDIYNQMLRDSGRSVLVTPVTAHYLSVLRTSVPYVLLLSFGIFAAAVSGALVALRLGYRLWGMVVLASLTALGGGVIRDVLLGGSRYPIYLLDNTTDIWIVLAAVATVALVHRLAKRDTSVLRAEWFATNADVVGFSIIALNGATIAIIVGAPIVWVLISAAMSVAGGGILTDIVARREHSQFRGELYEEIALLGTLVMLGLLWLTNGHEHSPWLIVLAVVATLVLLLIVRYLVLKYEIRYPGSKAPTTATSDEDAPLQMQLQ